MASINRPFASSAAPGAEERLSAAVSGEAPRVAVDDPASPPGGYTEVSLEKADIFPGH